MNIVITGIICRVGHLFLLVLALPYMVSLIMEFGSTPYIGLGQKQNGGTYIQYRTARQNSRFKQKTEQFRHQKRSKRAILCKIRPLKSVKVNANIERRIRPFGHNSAHFHFFSSFSFSFSFSFSSRSSASITTANYAIYTQKLCEFTGDVPFASFASIHATNDVSKDKTAITIQSYGRHFICVFV